jgi:acetylornithine deacetylase/succinyl-diaminopimelate desuccinylase-like protein
MPDDAVVNSRPSKHSPIEQYIKKHLPQATQYLRQFSAGTGEAEQTALEARHFKVQRWSLADGKTALFAETPHKEGAPTLLFYNHFSRANQKKAGVSKRDGRLVGPGTVAGGTFAARLMAIDSLLASGGELPLNLKWLIEGYSSTVNPNLEQLLKEHAAELKADFCLWPTGGYAPDGRAMISLGTKGILTVELRSRTMNQDGDSALAGVLPSAAWRIAWALNAIKGDTEEIRISGFGDESDEDLMLPGDDISLLLGSVADHKPRLTERLKQFGLEAYLMELRDPQVLLTEFFTPTANIAGFEAGSVDPKSKTTVPSSASARLDFRLVPNHDPAKVLQLLKQHLEYKDLGDIEVEQIGLALKPARTSPADPFVQTVIECVRANSELPPLIIPLSPGAEPVAFFKEALNDLPVVGLGLEHPTANQGEKSENIRASDFEAHARIVAHLLGKLAEQSSLPELDLDIEAFSFSE